MRESMDYLVCALLIGMGVTAVMDIWAAVRKRLLGIPSAAALDTHPIESNHMRSRGLLRGTAVWLSARGVVTHLAEAWRVGANRIVMGVQENPRRTAFALFPVVYAGREFNS